MTKIKCDINQQYLKTVDFHFAKSEQLSLTWSCVSRQRDTTSSGWKFKLNNLAVKGLRQYAVTVNRAIQLAPDMTTYFSDVILRSHHTNSYAQIIKKFNNDNRVWYSWTANTTHWPNAVLILARRLWHCTNIKTTLYQRIVLAEMKWVPWCSG